MNVQQKNKVDAQYDKLATELSWQRFASKVTNVELPHLHFPSRTTHLHLASPSGVTPFEFCQNFWQSKTRVTRLSCGVVCVILCVAVSIEYRLVQTDRRTDGRTDSDTTANTRAS